ncbi:MAG: hypothetical protein KBG40_02480 [Bacteroidales bacterium]|nr:hypothetical protein [Bacteroidales bacterium]
MNIMIPVVLKILFFAVFHALVSFEKNDLAQEYPVGDYVFVKRIFIGHDSIIDIVQGNDLNEILRGRKIVLGKRNNNISFQVSAPDTGFLSFMLINFDREWSRWQKEGIKDYTNLPAGSYSFIARYMVPNGTAIISNPIDFRVLPAWYYSNLAILCYVMIFILLAWTIYEQLKYRFARTQYMLEQIINTRTEELILEKEKTETLLQNVLPRSTADELMSKGKATKTKYNFVTVLFSDIQGFTKIAEETNPEVLIDELDKFFFYFDSVVEKYGIEKIKTIGDAYMCVGGLPEKNRTNPIEVILAALEIQEYMNSIKSSSDFSGMKLWDIRIGIHTGTVIAGVVGQKKLSYDIWGDTVNTASRMESSSEPGKINISGTTYEFVKDFFICKYRGKMPVKYKGEIDMYFVEGILEELRDENNKPNRKFISKMKKLKLLDIEEYVLKYFDEEASPNLYFHNSSYVRNICSQADLLANASQMSDEEYIPLKLASVFLITGYITDYDQPAEASCNFMREVLSRYSLLQEDADAAGKLIMKSFGNIIETESDRILHDAKYDYLGRVDYIKLTDRLFREESEYGKVKNREEWVNTQRKLLVEHEFLTTGAKLIRSVSVEEQLALILEYEKEKK